MITLQNLGDSILFTFDENDKYLNNGTISVPMNSLILVTDDSDMATFRKSATNDIFVSALYSDFGMTKAELEQWYAENMVSEVTEEDVDEKIAEAVGEETDRAVSAETALSGAIDAVDAAYKAADSVISGAVDNLSTALQNESQRAISAETALSGAIDTKIDESAITSAVTSASTDSEIPTAKAVYDALQESGLDEDTEKLISGSLNDLNERKLDASAYTPTDLTNYYTKSETSGATEISTALNAKQDTLVSGTNIKTINNESILGSGNVDVHGDWNENSSGSTSYIKNRPFYMEASASSECALACVPLDDEEWNMSYGCVETYTIQTTRTFAEGEKLGLDFIYENQYNCEYPQVSPQTIVNNSGTLTVGPYNGWTLTSSDGVNWTVAQGGNTFCIQPIIFWNPTTITYHKLDSKFIDSDIARTSAVTSEISTAVSGKIDTSAITTAVTSGSTDSEIPTAKAVFDAIPTGGGKAISAGTNISVTTGETADTINCTLPLSSSTSSNASKIILDNNYSFISNDAVISGKNDTTKASKSIVLGGNSTLLADGSGANIEYNLAFGSNNKVTASGAYKPSASYNFILGDRNDIYNASYCFALGYYNNLKKSFQFVVGDNNTVLNEHETLFGRYNVSSSASTTFGDSGNTLFSVGNGTSSSARHNALEIRQNGDIYITSGNTDIKLQDHLGGGGSSYTAGDGIDITNDVISVSGVVMSSAITTSISSSSTDAQVPSAKAVNDKLGGLSIVKLTQAEYDALATKDSNVLYVIVG